MFTQENIIDSYTRAEAIEDGVLVDISELAREAGFVFPVAITSALYNALEPHKEEKAIGQDIEGRLWDLLSVFRYYTKRGGRELHFSVFIQRIDGRAMPNTAMRKVRHLEGNISMYEQAVRAVCGPGDNLEPVITIMLPEED